MQAVPVCNTIVKEKPKLADVRSEGAPVARRSEQSWDRAQEVRTKVAFVNVPEPARMHQMYMNITGIKDCTMANLMQDGDKGCSYGCLPWIRAV